MNSNLNNSSRKNDLDEHFRSIQRAFPDHATKDGVNFSRNNSEKRQEKLPNSNIEPSRLIAKKVGRSALERANERREQLNVEKRRKVWRMVGGCALAGVVWLAAYGAARIADDNFSRDAEITYDVGPGDTASGIAQQFSEETGIYPSLETETMFSAEQLGVLQPGDEITVRGHDSPVPFGDTVYLEKKEDRE